MSGFPITGTALTTLACTTTSGNIAVAGVGTILRIYNAGSVVAYAAVGTTNAITAVKPTGSPVASTSLLCPPGLVEYTVPDAFSFVAGITDSSTATLFFQRGVSAP